MNSDFQREICIRFIEQILDQVTFEVPSQPKGESGGLLDSKHRYSDVLML